MADWALAELQMMVHEARSKYASGLPYPWCCTVEWRDFKARGSSDKERLLQPQLIWKKETHYGFIIG